jgi:hypothetical protein
MIFFSELFYSCLTIKISIRTVFCKQTNTVIKFQQDCFNEFINKHECVAIHNNLQFLKQIHDQFSNLLLPTRKQVVYSFNNQVYLAECKTINEIDIIEKIDRCTKDIFVKFRIEGNAQDGFLTKQGIVRPTSQRAVCPTKKTIFTLLSETVLILHEKRNIFVENLNNNILDLRIESYSKQANNSRVNETKKCDKSEEFKRNNYAWLIIDYIENNLAWKITENGSNIFMLFLFFYEACKRANQFWKKKLKHARTSDIGNLELGTGTRTQESKNYTEQNYTNPIVINSIETNQDSENQQNTYQCRYCQKSYKRFGNLKNHEIVCSKK